MELNINSPAYYSDKYGIDDEIYWICREISSLVKNKDYKGSRKGGVIRDKVQQPNVN